MRVSIAVLVLASVSAFAEPPDYADKADLLHFIDAEGKRVPVKTPADWQVRRGHILAHFQRVAGPLPPDSRQVPLDVRIESEEALDKVIRRKISFAVEEGDRVPAYLLISRELKGKAPAMLCLHQTTRIGKGEPVGLGGKPNLRYGLELAERGYVTLSPDYPNFGDSKCDPYALGYDSATMKGIWNHRRAVDLLQSLAEVDGERIGVIGHSLGGHNSIFVALFEPRIKVVVTSCGFNSFAKYMNGNLAGWSHRGYMPRIARDFGASAARMPFDFTELLGALAPRAVFINAPLHDDNFPVEGVRDCVRSAMPVFELLGKPKNLVAIYPDAAHDFPPDARRQAYKFIDERLGRH